MNSPNPAVRITGQCNCSACTDRTHTKVSRQIADDLVQGLQTFVCTVRGTRRSYHVGAVVCSRHKLRSELVDVNRFFVVEKFCNFFLACIHLQHTAIMKTVSTHGKGAPAGARNYTCFLPSLAMVSSISGARRHSDTRIGGSGLHNHKRRPVNAWCLGVTSHHNSPIELQKFLGKRRCGHLNAALVRHVNFQIVSVPAVAATSDDKVHVLRYTSARRVAYVECSLKNPNEAPGYDVERVR